MKTIDPAKLSVASLLKRMSVERQMEILERSGLLQASNKTGTATERQLKKAASKLGFLDFLEPQEQAYLAYCWEFWSRPNQRPDEGDSEWVTWLWMAGRGFGKTRTGAECVRAHAEKFGRSARIGLIGSTAADTRDVMVKGESGILAISPPWMRPKYEPSKRIVSWPNGAVATLFSAEEPERLRGPQYTFVWCDEIASWKNGVEAWDMMLMGLRLGNQPRVVATTTPKPVELIKRLVTDKTCRIISGSTRDNEDNLAVNFMSTIIGRYAGTQLGRQEIDGVLLLESNRALWKRSVLEATRVDAGKFDRNDMAQIVVSIDPAVTTGMRSDETGIIVTGRGKDRRGYVMADLSGKYSPSQWARVALQAYEDYDADRIIAEVNNGGDMVKHTIRTYNEKGLSGASVPFKQVRASRGKYTRAEPIASLFEQGRAGIVGVMDPLETQLATFDPLDGIKSPDRMDAMVWGLTDLMLTAGPRTFV